VLEDARALVLERGRVPNGRALAALRAHGPAARRPKGFRGL